MKIRKAKPFFFMTKFHLLRLSKGLKSPKFLLKLENTILKELMQIEREVLESRIYSENLLLRFSYKQRKMNTISRLHLCWRILQTPGQTRWLCYSLYSPVRGNAYKLSRVKLLAKIVRNWNQFSEEVLSYLSINNENTTHFNRIPLHQYWNVRLIQPLNIDQAYLLECKKYRKSMYGNTRSFKKFTHESNESVSDFTLARIIQWNSSCAKAFIEQSLYLKESTQLEKFIKIFPDFQDSLNARVSLNVVFHPKCNESFDQRIYNSVSDMQDVVTDVEIWHQRFIIKDKSWLLIDSTCSPRHDFVAGQWQFLEQNKLEPSKVDMLVPRKTNQVNADEAIFLIGRVDENWYHLLLDTLPRYLLLRDIKTKVPVLIRGDLPQTSKSFIESLIQREIIYVQPDDLVFVKRLYFVSARSTVYDSAPENSVDRVSFSPVIIQKQREWILQSFRLNESPVYPERIFFTRHASYRNLLNMDAVSRFLKKKNFHVIEPDESFYMNQASCFSQAKMIVSPGGAVLANMIFMQRGSRVISIRSWRGSDVPIWNSLADACELSHSEVIGVPTYFGFKSLLRTHSNYYVPLKRVKKVLDV